MGKETLYYAGTVSLFWVVVRRDWEQYWPAASGSKPISLCAFTQAPFNKQMQKQDRATT